MASLVVGASEGPKVGEKMGERVLDAYTGSCCCEEALGASDGALVSLTSTDRFGEDVVVSHFDDLAVGALEGSGMFL